LVRDGIDRSKSVRKAKFGFASQKIKFRAKNFLEKILEPKVKKLETFLFKNRDWNFRKDSAKTHEAKIVKS
jgi:hypothetical protein